MNTRWRFTTMLGLFMISVVGCGGKATEDGPPEGDVALLRSLVSQVPDATGNAKTFRTYFAKDAAVPADGIRQRFAKLNFKVVGTPAVSGDTATAQVSVREMGAAEPIGQVEWAFAKEGEQWKLK